MPITVSIGGDICPDGRIEQEVLNDSNSIERLVGQAQNIFRQSDLSILNLECPLSTTNEHIRKIGPCIKAHPDTIQLLTYLEIQLVTLANNHIRDFGDRGLEETLNQCMKFDIQTVGAGISSREAGKIYNANIKGRRLAIINATESEFANASPLSSGANPLDLISLLSDIKEARKNADHVVLIIHGGLEYVHYPSPQSVRLLRFLAEQQVTAILRHHPHYVQGFEVWKGVPIFYSLGNFLSDSANLNKPGWFEGIIVKLKIDSDDRCTFQIYPFEQCKDSLGISMMQGTEKKSYLEKLTDLSGAIQNPGMLKKTWFNIINDRKSNYLGKLMMPNYSLLRVFRKLKLLNFIVQSTGKKLLWEHYLRCETHREILLDIFEHEHDSLKQQ